MTDPEYQLERVSTRDVETKSDRTELWRNYLRTRQGCVRLTFRNGNDDFYSSASAQKVGHWQLVQFESDPLDYQRSARDVRDDGDDSHRLLIPLNGEFQLAQRDSAEIVHPGAIAFFHWGYPLYMRQDGPLRALIMTVPENSIALDRAAGAPLALDEGRPLVRMLGHQVRALAANRQDWTAQDFTVAFTSALTLLEGALDPARPVAPDNLAVRARAFMERHANDHTVTPEAIAAMCGCSARTLRNALREAGDAPPAAMLRTIRLDRARRRLSTPLPVDMDRIAAETGFSTTRRFRESFQQRFGLSPARMREQLFDGDTKR
ncbi:AraC family transcriptional regulator [Nocardia miyunensis]|uniref:AraC family transcriptional regulator n=1 Tax=Nocardia miyunensis TaxID=282684 RepID=UPI00082B90A7|nr:AraC family transcriptional regulator [Nocardia miyunensis]